MSVVATREEEREAQLDRTWQRPPGFVGALAAVNNQRIGVRYMVTAAVFFAIGGLMALAMRIQLAVSDNDFLDPQLFNELFTMHGSTMMYLFAVPFLEGLALYFLPLLIGSRDVAFPRLTAFSYWTYLFGGLIFYSAFIVGTVPDAGWFAYTPLSGPRFSGQGIDFFLLGLSLVEIAGLTAGAELVVTFLKFRAPGMTLARTPVMAWAIAIMAVMILFAFTALLTATVMLELDRTLGTAFFDADRGGTSLLWQHIFWFFGHPEVYIIFIPATGIVSMVVPVFARRPLSGYILVVMALLVTGFLSFGLWAHHMFTTGLPELALSFFTAASLMIALATGVQIFSWLATLWGQRPVLEPPMLFILGFLFVFVLGGITGVMIAVVPFNYQVHDTYFIVAHFHYVLIGGVVFPILAGMYYWLPKITGRMLDRSLGAWSFWLTFVGFNVTFFPMHVMGFFGLPRRVYTYPGELGLDGLNLVATIGAFVLAAGFGLYLFNVARSFVRGAEAPADPWRGETLEWSVSSPPPSYSFFRPPAVGSRHPLWTEEEPIQDDAVLRAREALAGRPETWRATLLTSATSARPQAVQWLPGPTLVPLALAATVLLMAIGPLVQIYSLTVFGAVLAAGVLWQWLRLRPPSELAPTAEEIETRSGLPVVAAGRLSVGWWGTIALVAVLGMSLAVMLFSYFYLRLFADAWPMGGLPHPALLLPLAAVAALGLSGAPLWLARRRLRDEPTFDPRALLGASAALGMVFLILQVVVLATSGFTPQVNAYASAFYVTHLLMGLYALAGVGVLLAGLRREDEPGWRYVVERHLGIAVLYWGFVIVGGVVVFAVLHLGPYVV
jgi:cytochrome c oxidase subunit I+III